MGHRRSRGAAAQIDEYLSWGGIGVPMPDARSDIRVTLTGGGHSASTRIADAIPNIVESGWMAISCSQSEECSSGGPGKLLTVEGIFCLYTAIWRTSPGVERQIDCNMAVAQEGLKGCWGAAIGKVILDCGNAGDVRVRARALAAAGSDARMSGCELPVIINSGSGNQGITVSVPVVVYARELNAPHERLLRALALANLTAIRQKTLIGCLSAYCGAITAGSAGGAAIAYLHGGDLRLVNHTIVNCLAILSGTICDGAKPSCAAKIACAVDAGLLGWEMALAGRQFRGGEGIVKKGVENTIANVGRLGRSGMRETDGVILEMMTE